MKYYILAHKEHACYEVESFSEARNFLRALGNKVELYHWYDYDMPSDYENFWYRYSHKLPKDWWIYRMRNYSVYDHNWHEIYPTYGYIEDYQPNTFHARKERRKRHMNYWRVIDPFIYRYDPVPGIHKYGNSGSSRFSGVIGEYRKSVDEDHLPFVKPDRMTFLSIRWRDDYGRSRGEYRNASWKNSKKRKQWM